MYRVTFNNANAMARNIVDRSYETHAPPTLPFPTLTILHQILQYFVRNPFLLPSLSMYSFHCYAMYGENSRRVRVKGSADANPSNSSVQAEGQTRAEDHPAYSYFAESRT